MAILISAMLARGFSGYPKTPVDPRGYLAVRGQQEESENI